MKTVLKNNKPKIRTLGIYLVVVTLNIIIELFFYQLPIILQINDTVVFCIDYKINRHLVSNTE